MHAAAKWQHAQLSRLSPDNGLDYQSNEDKCAQACCGRDATQDANTKLYERSRKYEDVKAKYVKALQDNDHLKVSRQCALWLG